MSQEILAELYTKLLALSDAGDKPAAEQLVKEFFPKLSEDEQGELLTRLYVQAMDDELAQASAIALVQEKGLAALDELDAAEKEAQEGGGPTTP